MKLVCAVALSVAYGKVAYDSDFLAFKAKFDRNYASHEEESLRYSIFANHMEFINEHNAAYARGEKTFDVGINRFADMTTEEFARKMNGYKSESERVGQTKHRCSRSFVAMEESPSSYDAREHGLVTRMKDQGQCGSCWAFGTIATYEGQVCKAGYKNCNSWGGASEQQVVSCSISSDFCLAGAYDDGCNGGWTENGAKYLMCHAPEEESAYPYVSGTTRKTGTCRASGGSSNPKATACTKIRSGSSSQLKNAVSSSGPVAVAIDASHQSFQLYRSGVYSEPACSSSRLDHAVTVVGYGGGFSGEYWIIKNSWGTSWGQQGYIHMEMAGNMCGTETEPIIINID
jgi:cathepsin L